MYVVFACVEMIWYVVVGVVCVRSEGVVKVEEMGGREGFVVRVNLGFYFEWDRRI